MDDNTYLVEIVIDEHLDGGDLIERLTSLKIVDSARLTREGVYFNKLSDVIDRLQIGIDHFNRQFRDKDGE